MRWETRRFSSHDSWLSSKQPSVWQKPWAGLQAKPFCLDRCSGWGGKRPACPGKDSFGILLPSTLLPVQHHLFQLSPLPLLPTTLPSSCCLWNHVSSINLAWKWALENNSTGQEWTADNMARAAWPGTPAERNRCNNVVINEKMIVDCDFTRAQFSTNGFYTKQTERAFLFSFLGRGLIDWTKNVVFTYTLCSKRGNTGFVPILYVSCFF